MVGYLYATPLVEIVSPGSHLTKLTKALMKMKLTYILSLDLTLFMLN